MEMNYLLGKAGACWEGDGERADTVRSGGTGQARTVDKSRG